MNCPLKFVLKSVIITAFSRCQNFVLHFFHFLFPHFLLQSVSSIILKIDVLHHKIKKLSKCTFSKVTKHATVKQNHGYRSFTFEVKYQIIIWSFETELDNQSIKRLATVEPQWNKPLNIEVLGITNDFQYPSNSKRYEKEPQYNATLYSKQILPVAWPWPFVILWFHRTTSVINQKKFTFENCSITEPIFLNWLHIEDINNCGKCFTKVSFERLNTTSRERLNLIWENAPADQQTAEMSVFTLLFFWQKEVKIKSK